MLFFAEGTMIATCTRSRSSESTKNQALHHLVASPSSSTRCRWQQCPSGPRTEMRPATNLGSISTLTDLLVTFANFAPLASSCNHKHPASAHQRAASASATEFSADALLAMDKFVEAGKCICRNREPNTQASSDAGSQVMTFNLSSTLPARLVI